MSPLGPRLDSLPHVTSPRQQPRPRLPWSRTERAVPRLVVRPIQRFMHLEVAGGLVLLAAVGVALVWANVAGASYADFWTTSVTVTIGDHTLTESLQDVVNDGLMAIFFLVVGLEVKRELVVGELSTRQAALLPLFAAVGGMVVPALIFLAVMGGDAGSNGWGIPMATDVAFALCALAALGRRAPVALVAFLLGVAVIDDIGAILRRRGLLHEPIAYGWLACPRGAWSRSSPRSGWACATCRSTWRSGLVVWFATFESGVHATIAGVALGLLTPVRPFQDPAAVSAEAVRIAAETDDHPDDPDADAASGGASRGSRARRCRRWRGSRTRCTGGRASSCCRSSPWPTRARARRESIDAATETPVALAVGLGLVVGKTLGLTAGRRPRGPPAAEPPAARGSHGCTSIGSGALAGIGFTVSLFIAGLAYSDPGLVEGAKIGIFAGSALAAVLGLVALAVAARRAASAGEVGAPLPLDDVHEPLVARLAREVLAQQARRPVHVVLRG